jgi:hypothetical protein
MKKIHSITSLKGLLMMLFASTAICFASCDKSDDVEQEPAKARPMELLYNESKGLPETSADSVYSFGKSSAAILTAT